MMPLPGVTSLLFRWLTMKRQSMIGSELAVTVPTWQQSSQYNLKLLKSPTIQKIWTNSLILQPLATPSTVADDDNSSRGGLSQRLWDLHVVLGHLSPVLCGAKPVSPIPCRLSTLQSVHPIPSVPFRSFCFFGSVLNRSSTLSVITSSPDSERR